MDKEHGRDLKLNLLTMAQLLDLKGRHDTVNHDERVVPHMVGFC